MDRETYNRREEDLAVAQRLVDAERARLAGACDIDSFEGLMREAIAEGARNAGRVTGARFAVGLTGKGIT
jgi:hypothetical protein